MNNNLNKIIINGDKLAAFLQKVNFIHFIKSILTGSSFMFRIKISSNQVQRAFSTSSSSRGKIEYTIEKVYIFTFKKLIFKEFLFSLNNTNI